MKKNSNSSYKSKYNGPAREITCSCGGTAKLRRITNYPFGRKAKGRSVSFYKCKSCNKRLN